MAGSWRHIVTKSGKFCGTRHIENLGDAYEALEECYGMIQWLADHIAFQHGPSAISVDRAEREDVIRQARANYKDGLDIGGTAKKRIFGE